MIHPYNLVSRKVIDGKHTFSIYRSMKLEFTQNMKLAKYENGYYTPRILSHWDKECNRKPYNYFAERFVFEDKIATAIAATLVRNPTAHITDVLPEYHNALRMWNSNPSYHAAQHKFSPEEIVDLFSNGGIIEKLGSGEISPELFCHWYRQDRKGADKVLTKSSQSYLWEIIKPRINAYLNYVKE